VHAIFLLLNKHKFRNIYTHTYTKIIICMTTDHGALETKPELL